MNDDLKTLRVEAQNGMVMIRMDNPPVNQLSDDFTGELERAVTGSFQDEEVAAIVLTGTGKNFIAGADLKEIYRIQEKDLLSKKVEHAADFFNQIELGPKPVVAAINGNALGGGLELAMACHYRVASRGAKLGLPEVKMGLIPGAGGTQRLPRLVGLVDALDMITTGSPITAEKALSMGLIDELVEPENLVPAALAAAKKFISGELSLNTERTRFKMEKLPSSSELKDAVPSPKATTLKRSGGSFAQQKAIEAIREGLSVNVEADISRERQLFCDCALSDAAKNLMETFLSSGAGGKTAANQRG